MGQTLSAPMVLVGLWFIVTASRRTVRLTDHAGAV
jgi:prolipoprotein diacylglyceryltransferase